MAISEAKMKIVIGNYFKSECDINTSIKQAFEKGFRIGVRKAQSAELNSSEIPNNWIPCTPETMPEEHEWLGTKKFGTTKSDEVYVTFENPKGERFCKHLSFQNGELSDYDKLYMDAWYKGGKPIAWMPLPKPYQPKEGQENEN